MKRLSEAEEYLEEIEQPIDRKNLKKQIEAMKKEEKRKGNWERLYPIETMPYKPQNQEYFYAQ